VTTHTITSELKEYILKGLRKGLREHYYCDDGWYTCPAHPEGSCNTEYSGSTECICGADKHNAEIQAVIDRVEGIV